MQVRVGLLCLFLFSCNQALQNSTKTTVKQSEASFATAACDQSTVRYLDAGGVWWHEFSIEPKPDQVTLRVGSSEYNLDYLYEKWILADTNIPMGSQVSLRIDNEMPLSFSLQPGDIKSTSAAKTIDYLSAGGDWWHEFTIEPKPQSVSIAIGAETHQLEYLYEKWILRDTRISQGDSFTLLVDNDPPRDLELNIGRLETGCNGSPASGQPVAIPGMESGSHNYGYALQLTPLYFAANQLGQLSDRRLPWRNDSQTDGEYSGGYVDAGDNIMFGKAQYASIAYMCITADVFSDELAAIGQLDEIKTQIKHGTDFLVKNHRRNAQGETLSLVAQLSDSPTDHPRWLSIEESNHFRPVYVVDQNNRGSDYAGLAAAALGFCSRVFDGAYRSDLAARSQSLLQFSTSYRGLGENNGNINTVYKNSNGDEDDIAFGALGVYRATNNNSFLQQAQNTIDDTFLGPWAGVFDHQEHIVFNLLALWGGDNAKANTLRSYFNNWKNVGSELKRTDGGYIIHDSNNWGSTGSIAPALFNMAIYSKLSGDNSWDQHIKSQIDYILGSNPRNLSYLCGYGAVNCSRVHHRGASGGSAHNGGDNEHMLWGAILGGPTENDYDFQNSHSNWTGNEPTIGYNSQIQAPLIYLQSKFGGQPLSDGSLQNLINNWSGY